MNYNAFQKKTDFKTKMNGYSINVEDKLYDVKSDYFLVSVDATIGRTQLHMYSLLERMNNKVATIRRSVGTY